MTIRRLFTAALVMSLTLVAAGCGGDDDKATDKATDTTTTTAAAGETTTTAADGATSSPADASTTTAAPGAFDAAVDGMNAELDASGTDFCKIANSASSAGTAGPPSTPEETKALYEFYKRVFDQIAGALAATGPEGAKDADLLRAAAEQMMTDAAATNYDPKQFPTDGPPQAFRKDAVVGAMQRLSTQINEKCTQSGN